MSVFAFGSAKASPGVTTSLLALAVAWPRDRRVVVAELDPDGGDMAAWHHLSPEPGLLSYAASGRRDLRPETILAHTQPLPSLGRVEVVAGPAAPEQAEAALATLLAAGLGERVGALTDVDVLLDCGLLRRGSPAMSLLASVAATVLVARPTLAEIAHLRPRVAALRTKVLALLLIGDRPYSAEEVAAALDVPVVGVLAKDPRGAGTLAARSEGGRRLARSNLVRSAVPVGERLGQFGAQFSAAHSCGADNQMTAAAGHAMNGQVVGR